MKPSIEEIARIKTLMPTEVEMEFMDRYNPLTLFGILKKYQNSGILFSRLDNRCYQ